MSGDRLPDSGQQVLRVEGLGEEIFGAGLHARNGHRDVALAAQEEFRKQKCSFLVFDYLLTEQLKYPGWPKGCEPITVSEPGTYMPIE